MSSEKIQEAIKLLQTIKSETRPIEGHTDPNAIQDCWGEVFELLESEPEQEAEQRIIAIRTAEVKRLRRKINYLKAEIEKLNKIICEWDSKNNP